MIVKILEAISTTEVDLHIVFKIRYEDVLHISRISSKNIDEGRVRYFVSFVALYHKHSFHHSNSRRSQT